MLINRGESFPDAIVADNSLLGNESLELGLHDIVGSVLINSSVVVGLHVIDVADGQAHNDKIVKHFLDVLADFFDGATGIDCIETISCFGVLNCFVMGTVVGIKSYL